MLTQVQDITAVFNTTTGNSPSIDLGKWNSVTFQIQAGGVSNFQGSNDNVYFTPIAGFELASPNTFVTSGQTGSFFFNCRTKYFRFAKTGVTATSVYMLGMCNF